MNITVHKLVTVPTDVPESGLLFLPEPPAIPQRARGNWELRSVQPVSPGALLCSWTFQVEPSVTEALSNAYETIVFVYHELRRLFPEQPEYADCLAIDCCIAHILVALGAKLSNVPQHLRRYLEPVTAPDAARREPEQATHADDSNLQPVTQILLQQQNGYTSVYHLVGEGAAGRAAEVIRRLEQTRQLLLHPPPPRPDRRPEWKLPDDAP
jgi:hypothetical protein